MVLKCKMCSSTKMAINISLHPNDPQIPTERVARWLQHWPPLLAKVFHWRDALQNRLDTCRRPFEKHLIWGPDTALCGIVCSNVSSSSLPVHPVSTTTILSEQGINKALRLVQQQEGVVVQSYDIGVRILDQIEQLFPRLPSEASFPEKRARQHQYRQLALRLLVSHSTA